MTNRPQRQTNPKGFTLVEVLLGTLFVAAALMLIPSFLTELTTGYVLWGRRRVARIIETQFDQACNLVNTTNVNAFNALTAGNPPPPVVFPPELTGAFAAQEVKCLDDNFNLSDPSGVDGSCPFGERLKRIRLTITWTSRSRHPMTQTGNSIISKAGICGKDV